MEGARRWRLSLAPGAEKKLTFTYTVKIDTKNEIVGGNVLVLCRTDEPDRLVQCSPLRYSPSPLIDETTRWSVARRSSGLGSRIQIAQIDFVPSLRPRTTSSPAIKRVDGSTNHRYADRGHPRCRLMGNGQRTLRARHSRLVRSRRRVSIAGCHSYCRPWMKH